MLGHIVQPEIKELIQKRDLATLKEMFQELHPGELADLINDLPETEGAVVFRILPRDLAADAFEYLDLETQKMFIKSLAQDDVAAILNEMAPDDRTAFFQELPGTVTRKLIGLLSPFERTITQSLLGYPENSVGRLMTPDYIAVEESRTIDELMQLFRKKAKEVESLDYIYVTDKKGKLIDDIPLKEIVAAPPEATVGEIMDGHFIFLSATDDKEKAIKIFKEYDRVALPVVDFEGCLLGIVTIDDVLDVIERANTEDIQKFGGLEALDYPYVRTPPFDLVKKRVGWLIVLFLSEMLTATAMGYFEDEISKAVVLALFVPLIISSGGNSGSQAATLIIRAMAVHEITLKDWWFVMKREVFSGLSLGLVLGCIGFCRILVWSLFSDIYGAHWFLVALTVGLSLIGVVFWGTLSGSMLPFVLRKFGFDPASSSAPFVATLVDVTGIVIYFSMAAIFLSGTLL